MYIFLFPSNAIKRKIFLIHFAHFWVHLQKVYMLRISSNFKSTHQQRDQMLQKQQHCQRCCATFSLGITLQVHGGVCAFMA